MPWPLEQQPTPWEMADVFRLCTTPHSVLKSFNTEPNPTISDSNAVTYKTLFGHDNLNNLIEDVLCLALSSFDPGDSDVAFGIRIPLPFNLSALVMEDKGFRIRIAIINYYWFVVLHDKQYRSAQEYPAALDALHGAVHETLSSFLQLPPSESEKRYIIFLVVTRLFSDLPIPPKWSDLNDIRKKALPLTTGFEFQAGYRDGSIGCELRKRNSVQTFLNVDKSLFSASVKVPCPLKLTVREHKFVTAGKDVYENITTD
ncbi:hypothetical protein BDZ89DRAFT_1131212 [Hymenopellis radicata]|nr:hypothetical protein BDZ89DRAFT_1131212 [Hymenopellis radicata]